MPILIFDQEVFHENDTKSFDNLGRVDRLGRL